MYIGVSSTSDHIDMLAFSVIYLTISICLWIMMLEKSFAVKIVSVILMFFVFGVGYFISTVGVLGLGFAMDVYPERTVNIGKNLVCKEVPLGNALTDSRGKVIEIYKTLSDLPVLEWKITEKYYPGMAANISDVNYSFNEKDSVLTLRFLNEDKRFDTIPLTDHIQLHY
jgi:hypothetical protein